MRLQLLEATVTNNKAEAAVKEVKVDMVEVQVVKVVVDQEVKEVKEEAIITFLVVEKMPNR